jgi:hypothetical protein
MAGRLVTIATFENATQAQVAKNALEAEGIRAVLGDEMTVDLFWNLSNAIGGVKVQVLEENADRAVEILERELGPDEGGEVDEEQLAAAASASAREGEEERAAEAGPARPLPPRSPTRLPPRPPKVRSRRSGIGTLAGCSSSGGSRWRSRRRGSSRCTSS